MSLLWRTEARAKSEELRLHSVESELTGKEILTVGPISMRIHGEFATGHYFQQRPHDEAALVMDYQFSSF